MQRLALSFCLVVSTITAALPSAADETDRRGTATYKKYGPWIGTAVQVGSPIKSQIWNTIHVVE